MLSDKHGDVFGYIIEPGEEYKKPDDFPGGRYVDFPRTDELTIYYKDFYMKYVAFNADFEAFDLKTFLELPDDGMPTFRKKYKECKSIFTLSVVAAHKDKDLPKEFSL